MRRTARSETSKEKPEGNADSGHSPRCVAAPEQGGELGPDVDDSLAEYAEGLAVVFESLLGLLHEERGHGQVGLSHRQLAVVRRQPTLLQLPALADVRKSALEVL